MHLLIIDLFPPSLRDPQGIHKLIWDEIVEEPFELPADKPLTLAAYSAGAVKSAYIEPVAVDDLLPEMPVFLEPDRYVLAPLEPTYQTTWNACPVEFREAVLEDSVRSTSVGVGVGLRRPFRVSKPMTRSHASAER